MDFVRNDLMRSMVRIMRPTNCAKSGASVNCPLILIALFTGPLQLKFVRSFFDNREFASNSLPFNIGWG
ncbi:hypothetical protein M404DRAFT_994928 [Pisolithus tinctorius Marx 270]|uniref:Uncharacterized protein n=1 Tax=Pisolithus tinctorius Marx 270 TaxID=870435 RepID=A0A0C3PBZ7_PISTI|nr:hypothetical protein M404DRAFT_994928 [Pisolithus tinctorius Marx 270]